MGICYLAYHRDGSASHARTFFHARTFTKKDRGWLSRPKFLSLWYIMNSRHNRVTGVELQKEMAFIIYEDLLRLG